MTSVRSEAVALLRHQGLIVGDPEFLLLRGLAGRDGKSVVLVFDGAPTPSLVLKIPRGTAGEERLRLEHQVLERLHRMAPRLQGTIPEPLGLQRLPKTGRLVLVERALRASERASSSLSGRGISGAAAAGQLLDRAYEWLADFQQATAEAIATDPGDRPHVVEAQLLEQQLVAPMERAATVEPALGPVAAALRDESASFAKMGIPCAWTHGDFCPKNLLLSADDRTIGVADWEMGAPQGLPTTDALYAAIKAAYFLFDRRPDGLAHGLRQAFVGEGPIAAAIQGSVQRFLVRRSIPPEFATFAFPVPLLQMAAHEQRRTGAAHNQWHDLLAVWAPLRSAITLRATAVT